MSIRVTVNPPIEKIMGEMSSETRMAMARGVLRAANIAGGIIARNVIKLLPGGTGQLARSFLPARFIGGKDSLTAAAQSDLEYAAIHDDGGTIRSSRPSGVLAIPVSARAKGSWPRDWARDSLALIPSKKPGKALLIDTQTEGLMVHYVLQESVKIDGTRYIKKSEADALPDIDKAMAQAIEQAQGKAAGKAGK